MSKYDVEINQLCMSSHRENEPQGAWSEYYSNTFVGVRKSNKEYPSISTTLDLAPGTEVFVVWIEWTNGDSFGWANRGNVEPLALFTNATDAYKFRELIEELGTPQRAYNQDTIEYNSTDGQTIKVFAGDYTGYFEILEDVHVEATYVGPERRI